MFGIGTGELLLLLFIALLVLGPERMPKMARDVGKVVGDLRRTSDELREEFLNADKLLDKVADSGTETGNKTENKTAEPAPVAALPEPTPEPASEPAPDAGATHFDPETGEPPEMKEPKKPDT